MNKISFPTFRYFVDYYINTINGGGSFSRNELVDLFKKYEEPESTSQLLNEANKLEQLMEKEDWEIDKEVLDFILKNGKNNIKNWVLIIRTGLK